MAGAREILARLVRIGLHAGQAIKDAEKFFDKTVIQAFRIADQAHVDCIPAASDLPQPSPSPWGTIRLVLNRSNHPTRTLDLVRTRDLTAG